MECNFESDLTCSICWDIADNAVETKCCSHIFCERCLVSIVSCPLCCSKPFSYSLSTLARRLIGNLMIKCPNEGCGMNVARSDISQHNLLCQSYQCLIPNCTFKAKKLDLMNHLVSCHGDCLMKILDEYYSKSSSNKEDKELNYTNDFIATKVNSTGRQARLGATGKYYCSGKLDLSPKCICCDGACGPTNGCNCSSCMALDISTRKLPPGWYVNKEGFSCRKGPNGVFYCGRKMDLLFSDGYCGPNNGPNCKSCKVIGLEECAYLEALSKVIT